MKKARRLTTTQRWLRAGLAILAGMMFGGVMAFLSGFFHGYGTTSQEVEGFILLVGRLGFVLSVLASLIYQAEARGFYNGYIACNEDEEELVDTYYRKTFRFLEFATIWFNVASTLLIFNLTISHRLIFMEDRAELISSIWEPIGLLVVLVLQVTIFKLTQTIRNYKLSAFPTTAEVKYYVYSVDEGERQAYFERAFLTIFNLNQRILPLAYLVIYAIATISQTQQLVAYLVVALIHIYINITQFQMVRNYFK